MWYLNLQNLPPLVSPAFADVFFFWGGVGDGAEGSKSAGLSFKVVLKKNI